MLGPGGILTSYCWKMSEATCKHTTLNTKYTEQKWKLNQTILDSDVKEYYILVGGWTNPFEKYARQIGPSISPKEPGWKFQKKNIELPPSSYTLMGCETAGFFTWLHPPIRISFHLLSDRFPSLFIAWNHRQSNHQTKRKIYLMLQLEVCSNLNGNNGANKTNI